MNNRDKAYLEIKVTFLHVVILLVGVIIIGIFLFYLGYQAGKSSLKSQARAQLTEEQGQTKEFRLLDETAEQPIAAQKKQPSIEDELKQRKPPQQIKEKTVSRKTYYSIQVGAFSSFSNARNYSEKFGKMGYPTEILSTISKNRELFRVRVGQFKTRTEALKEKAKLETMENKKFVLKKSG